jgi:hypothetical protein
MKITISHILVVVALLLTGMGGYLDMCGKSGIRVPGTAYVITKDHLRNDGSFVLFLAVAINVLSK